MALEGTPIERLIAVCSAKGLTRTRVANRVDVEFAAPQGLSLV